ncbi:hypothetical protein GOBAR_DD19257 [Gossypium barbadense]|nr:hypothetical protein GOBAR_DD19257 [Gossypium barbadense]
MDESSESLPLVVREPRAPSTIGRARASSTISTLVLGCEGASNTIGNLEHWMCGCLKQQRHPGASDVRAKEKVRDSVREEWVFGGDFNAIMNDAEKEGGRRGVKAQMNEFKEVMDEMALVDIKPNSGWFTWVNNRNEGRLIKERLDRFLTSVAVVENFPFIATKVVRQTQSNHDAIILNLWGQKLKDYPKDKRLCFKFDVCWVGDEKAENVIERAWNSEGIDYGKKMDRFRLALGLWQCKKFGKMKSEMQNLEKQIELVIDFASREDSGKS